MGSPTIGYSYQRDGVSQASQVLVSTSGAGVEIGPISVAGATTDGEIDIAFPYARLNLLYILSTRDITLEANDGTTPDFTLNIKADSPFIWHSKCGYSNPCTANVTKFLATLGSGAAANLSIYVDYDPTP